MNTSLLVTLVCIVVNSLALNPPAETLVSKYLLMMTVEEKVGQLTQLDSTFLLASGSNTTLDPTLTAPWFNNTFGIGSTIGNSLTPQDWVTFLNNLQNQSIYNTRLGIPLYHGVDSIHGVGYMIGATFFPQPIGCAATFNPGLLSQMGNITAYEMKAVGLSLTFSPILGTVMSPFWPRIHETFGEDPFLSSHLTRALIPALQQSNPLGLTNETTPVHAIISNPKHFIGYSVPNRNNKDRTPSWVSERMLLEYFLPPFQAAIESDCGGLMANSGELNGIPVHADPKVCKTLLRDSLGFLGPLNADYQDILHLHKTHETSPTMLHAAKVAIQSGIDVSMGQPPDNSEFASNLVNLVNSGKVSMERLDQAVGRVLTLKHKLGYLQNPSSVFVDPNNPAIANIGSTAHRQVALTMARESVTLLQNTGNVLPLSFAISSIALTGMSADSLSNQNGGQTIAFAGAPDSEFPFGSTIKDGFEMFQSQGASFDLLFSSGSNISQAADDCEQADVCVVAIGETPYAEGTGNIQDLDLDSAQQSLVTALYATGKPVIVILIEGRPRTFQFNATVIVNAYLPGSEGGQAIVELLFGQTTSRDPLDFTGRLPYSYPTYQGDAGQYYHKRLIIPSQSPVPVFSPRWYFGFGLSYNTYYFSLELSATQIPYNASVNATVLVSNKGSYPSAEVIQVYLRDVFASVTPPTRGLLKGFQKVWLNPGESESVTFEITPDSMSFVGAENRKILEPGEFIVYIGNTELSASFVVEDPESLHDEL